MGIEVFHPKSFIEGEIAWHATLIGFHFVEKGIREGVHLLKEGKVITIVTGAELIAKAQEHMGDTHALHEIFNRHHQAEAEKFDYSDYAGDSQFDPEISFTPIH